MTKGFILAPGAAGEGYLYCSVHPKLQLFSDNLFITGIVFDLRAFNDAYFYVLLADLSVYKEM